MGFKNFCENNNGNNNNVNINSAETKKVEELYDEYKDKSEDELLNELFKNVAKQKQDGTFNYDGLVSTLEKVSPFLTKEQNLKIKEILKNIQ